VIEFIIAALAVYRVARMIALEDGLFDVFARSRGWVIGKFAHFEQSHWVARGVQCPLCIGFWLALLGAVIINHWEWWLAIAGAQTLLQKLEKE